MTGPNDLFLVRDGWPEPYPFTMTGPNDVFLVRDGWPEPYLFTMTGPNDVFLVQDAGLRPSCTHHAIVQVHQKRQNTRFCHL